MMLLLAAASTVHSKDCLITGNTGGCSYTLHKGQAACVLPLSLEAHANIACCAGCCSPATQPGGNARQQPLGQIHCVGNTNNGQAAALTHGPLKQVV